VGKALAFSGSPFDRLIALVQKLRSPGGCPWDRVQTPETIKIYLIEEAYEVLEAIESGTHEEVCGELGDLLFHIVFLAGIFEEVGAFNVTNVVEAVTEKMIRRHPHVFGEAMVSSAHEVMEQWHEIKMGEAKDNDVTGASFLDSVPKRLPALMRAYRLVERASRVGLNGGDVASVLMKVEEDLTELKACLGGENQPNAVELFGNVLFGMANLGRLAGVHPETALMGTISRFVTHFKLVEERLREQDRTLESASPEEIPRMWKECGTDENTPAGSRQPGSPSENDDISKD
jgi:tetrapyrrole methylase family protein/MazG family protein